MRTRISTVVLVAFVLGGCAMDGADGAGGGAGGKADGWGDGEVATITFAEDWSETLTGTLRSGGALRVRFAADRLPECRGEMGGMPQWGLSAWASLDGGEAEAISLELAGDGLFEGTFESLGEGADLAIWFSVNDRWGCVAYDSDFGANYHFEIGEAVAAGTVQIHFDASWSVELSNPIHAGAELIVSYDLERLPECRGTMYGRPAWSITGWYSIDGGTARSFEVSRVEGSERVPQDAVITMPRGEEIAFWFEVTNRWGCHEWDSNYGGNWTFPISP